ncbi:flavin-containing monooxygenase [Rhodococcus erythropolis]
MSSRKVAIIGAGAAGLANAKAQIDVGNDVTIYEVGSQLAGMWQFMNDNGRSSAYSSLHINTPRPATNFEDFDFVTEPAMFPSHAEMARYLNDYADHFGLRERVKFNAEVTKVEPTAPESGATRWSLTTADGFTKIYDTVIVATGHLTDPVLPSLFDDFTGRLIHSHEYKEPKGFRDERVLVVGSGNSAVDIAADMATTASHASIAIRSPEMISPKVFLGRPLGVVESWFRKSWLPADANLIVRRLATRLVHGKMETWGIETPKGRTHPISQATLIQHIAYNRVTVRPGVVSTSGKTVTFSDGSTEEFDAIIAATGYTLSFPFLSESIVSVDGSGSLNLYGRAVAPRWPGLYFAGYFNTNGLSNPRMMEYQARWIAKIESGQVLVPSVEDMLIEVAELKRWLAKRYPAGPRYAFELEPKPYLEFIKTEEAQVTVRRTASALDAAGMWAQRGVTRRTDAHLIEKTAVRSAESDIAAVQP